jgi:hypothetical protein
MQNLMAGVKSELLLKLLVSKFFFMRWITSLFLVMFCFGSVYAKIYSGIEQTDFLNFEETKSLLTNIKPKRSEVDKLGELMNTAFFSNQSNLHRIPFQQDETRYKNFLRVTHWNLESVDVNKLKEQLNDHSHDEDNIFNVTDILTLNSVGYYNEAADFQNVSELFSNYMSGAYVFAPEFLEASYGLLAERKLFKDFRALSGNAIVSRYPILMAKVLRLPACYDWFHPEEQRILYDPDDPIKAKNRAGEGKVDLVRRGGRVALIADIALPNSDVVTVVNAQLENRAEPKCRLRQLNSILSYIKPFKNPVVFAVDMNNIGKSAAPQTLEGVVEKTLKSPKFYIKQVVSRLNPFSLFTSVTSNTYGRYRKISNPASNDIPILLPNPSRRLFRAVEDYKFEDGAGFDFSGVRELANSNDRERSYAKTYEYKTWLGRSKRKLDWIFVKSVSDQKDIYYYPVEPITLAPENTDKEQDSKHYPISLKIMI